MIPLDASADQVIKTLGSLVVEKTGVDDAAPSSPTTSTTTATTDESPRPTEDQSPTTEDQSPTKPITKKTKKKKPMLKPLPCPDIKVFVGNFAHCTSEGEVDVMKNKIIGVEGGKVC